MNELQIFNHTDFGQIRTVTINDEPWLVGKDVAQVLGYAKPENALAAHVDEEDKTYNSLWFDPKVDTSDYTRLCVDLVCYARYSSSNSIKIGVGQDIPTSITNPGNFEAYMSNIFSTNRETYCVNIDSVNQEEYVKIYAFGVTGEIYNVWLE